MKASRLRAFSANGSTRVRGLGPSLLAAMLLAGSAAAAELPPAVDGTLPAVAAAGSAEPSVGAAEPVLQSEIDLAWFGAGPSLDERAERLEQRAMELGAGDVDHAARALISPQAEGMPMRNARLATRLAPNLPIAHMAEARALWESGQREEAVEAAVRAVRAIPRNLEASLWLAGSLLVMLAAVILIGSVCFVAAVAGTLFPRAAHDLGDLVPGSMPGFARAALLSVLLLVPILLGEGLLGFLLGLFALGFIYGSAAHRLSLALAAALIVLALHPVSRMAGRTLSALDADPVGSASFAVLQGFETDAEVEVLRSASSEDSLAEQALAVRARRMGQTDEAQARYESLLLRRPMDPVVSTNLANLRFREGQSEEAIRLYEDAATRLSSAVLLFNLSQAYASAFRMEEFESTMALAQRAAPAKAAALSRAGDASFVADLPLPVAQVRERMLEVSSGESLQRALQHRVAPGLLGSGWMASAGGFALVALLTMLFGGRYEHSSSCTRCGRRICIRCDATFWNSDVCDPCHHLYHLPETTDPALRTARLAVLRKRELLIEKLALGAALTLPGAAGLLARRPDHAFVGILLFVVAAVMVVWRNGVVPDPLTVGALGPIGFLSAAAIALLAYAGFVFSGVVIRRSL